MRKRLATIAAAFLIAGLAVPATFADPADDAHTAALTFVTALFSGDYTTACGMVTADFLGRVGGSTQTCIDSFSGDQADPAQQDGDAESRLYEAWQAAQSASYQEPGAFFPAPAARLARKIAARDPNARVVVGNGPTAARDVSANTIVVDAKRSTKRKIVLYDESDSGQIWQLVAALVSVPKISRAAKGVPATPTPEPLPALDVRPAELTTSGDAHVAVVATAGTLTARLLLVLKLVDGVWKVDDIYFSIFSFAPPT